MIIIIYWAIYIIDNHTHGMPYSNIFFFAEHAENE